MSAGHSILAPSAAARWMACHGSVHLERALPDPGSVAAREGECAHLVARGMFDAWDDPAGGEYLLSDGSLMRPTDEMFEGAQLWCEYLESCGPGRVGVGWYLEHTIPIPRVHEACWGTPDAFGIDAVNGVLYLPDYKFGHRYVDVFENWQLIAYAGGVLSWINENYPSACIQRIVLAIVQPRAYRVGKPVRTWEVTPEQLRPYNVALFEAAKRIIDGDHTLQVNTECWDCRARHACKALLAAGGIAADMATQSQPAMLDADSVGLQLSMVNQAITWLESLQSGLEEDIKARIAGGEKVPGYQLAPGQGKRVWKMSAAEVAALGTIYGVDLTKPTDVVTPTQARKLLPDPDLIDGYSEVVTGAVQLKKVDASEARKVFVK